MRVNQTRLESGIESSVNVVTGFVISLLVWVLIIPIFWPHLNTNSTTSIGIVCIFTISSWLRSYFWRRFFENDVHKMIRNVIQKYYKNS